MTTHNSSFDLDALKSEIQEETDEQLFEHLAQARNMGLLLCQRIYGGSTREEMIAAVIEAEQERNA